MRDATAANPDPNRWTRRNAGHACPFETMARVRVFGGAACAWSTKSRARAGLMPGRSEMVRILNTSMLPPESGYKHHDWMDEIDGPCRQTQTQTQTAPRSVQRALLTP